jgi:hypothetical protein
VYHGLLANLKLNYKKRGTAPKIKPLFLRKRGV